MSAKEPRRELTAAQIDMVRTVSTQFFPFGTNGIGTHPGELAEAEAAAQVASNLFRRAAEVHQGLLVSWKQMCDAAFLTAAANQLKESQDVLEPLLLQLGVELVRQNNWRKGAALPGFRVARSGRNEGAGEEQPDRASEPEDLTAPRSRKEMGSRRSAQGAEGNIRPAAISRDVKSARGLENRARAADVSSPPPLEQPHDVQAAPARIPCAGSK